MLPIVTEATVDLYQSTMSMLSNIRRNLPCHPRLRSIRIGMKQRLCLHKGQPRLNVFACWKHYPLVEEVDSYYRPALPFSAGTAQPPAFLQPSSGGDPFPWYAG
jgi:hypothetical protein